MIVVLELALLRGGRPQDRGCEGLALVVELLLLGRGLPGDLLQDRGVFTLGRFDVTGVLLRGGGEFFPGRLFGGGPCLVVLGHDLVFELRPHRGLTAERLHL